MALIFEIAASILVAIIFILLAIISQLLAWPIWVIVITFLLLFILSSIGLAYLIIVLRPKDSDEEDDKA